LRPPCARPGRAVALAALSALACAHAVREELPPPPPTPPALVETGLASYYGWSLEGQPTADGHRYERAAFTCAHRSHPFGTRLLVTDLENGRSVVVRVNDRGPFEPGRVVDLSWAAARKLGMLRRGLARVRVEPLRP